jgi:hypothetical protein
LPVSRADLTGLIIVYAGTLFTSLEEEGVRKPGEKARSAAASRHHPPPRPALVAAQVDNASFPASTGARCDEQV